MDLVLFGIQGSGKGTQAKRIAQEFGYQIFEMGGELRKLIASGSDLGKVVASYIDKGHHAPTEIVMHVLKHEIHKIPRNQKILFDGVPRNLEQMGNFDIIMAEFGRQFRCINLVIPRQVAVDRIMGRSKQEGRPDDADADAIRRRLELFQEKTVPVIEHYTSRGNMVLVDATTDIDHVYGQLRDMINEWHTA